MKILLLLSNYSRLTGSEIYTYELARVLHKRGHEVHVMATITGGEIMQRTQDMGVEVHEVFAHPDLDFDIVHSAQPGPTAYGLRYFPDAKHICTIHSSLQWEKPLKSDQIKKYICIRPEVRERIVEVDGISRDKTVVIYNGVDTRRFNNKPSFASSHPPGNAILFVGTFDYLRANTIEDLVQRSKEDGKALWLVSEVPEDAQKKFPPHVKFLSPTWDVEEYNKACTETASVYLGRTTIEGWLCGKPGWVYNVDGSGKIIGEIELLAVPKPAILKQFDIEYMTDKVLEVYGS